MGLTLDCNLRYIHKITPLLIAVNTSDIYDPKAEKNYLSLAPPFTFTFLSTHPWRFRKDVIIFLKPFSFHFSFSRTVWISYHLLFLYKGRTRTLVGRINNIKNCPKLLRGGFNPSCISKLMWKWKKALPVFIMKPQMVPPPFSQQFGAGGAAQGFIGSLDIPQKHSNPKVSLKKILPSPAAVLSS